MKKIISSLLVLCLLVSCQAPVSESGEKVTIVSSSSSEEYQVMIPIDMNESREFHEQRQNTSEDFGNMGEQLIALSKEYFNPSEYVLGEGSIITYDDLMKLRRRESETNESIKRANGIGKRYKPDCINKGWKRGVSLYHR